MEKRTVYILFTRSGTWFSRLIGLATAGEFTHVSLGLEGPGGRFYSFARKNPRTALPAGLVEERAGRGFFSLHPGTPCALYVLEVSQESYEALGRWVEKMYAHRGEYRYNLLGALACFFHLRLRRRRHYFCSQFVAEALAQAGAVKLDKPPALVRPMDLFRLERLRRVAAGTVGALAA